MAHRSDTLKRGIGVLKACALVSLALVSAVLSLDCRLVDRAKGPHVARNKGETARVGEDWINIGVISPQDVSLASAALKRVGIASGFEGSVVYGIYVHPADRGQAIETLKKDSLQHDYYIRLPGFTHAPQHESGRK